MITKQNDFADRNVSTDGRLTEPSIVKCELTSVVECIGPARNKIRVNAFGSEQGVAEYTETISEEPGTETYIKKTDATTTEELPGATLQVYSLNEGS